LHTGGVGWTMGEKVAELPEPFEILELRDGESVRLKASGYALGRMSIKPRYPGAPESKEIQALRLRLPAGVKTVGPPFWDVTSQTLIAQLKPHLEDLVRTGREFKITAHGEAPRKRFELELL